MSSIEIIDLKFKGLEHAIASYLIRTNEGPVLIETGPHSTFPVLKEELSKLGFNIGDIRHVFLTHIHLDHAGAAWAFAEAGATIYVHPFGAKHIADPSKLMASAKMIYKDQMDSLWGEMKPIPEAQLSETAHEEIITIGDVDIKSHHTPGHAKHHIAWQFEDTIFAGDVAGVKIGNGLIQPPCPPPDIDIEDWLLSIELIKKISPTSLYLTHYDKILSVTDHLSDLTRQLIDWSEFVKTKWEQGLSNDEIEPLFVAFTNSQLAAAGLGKSTIDQYQAANPSWMSVAGLVRYWNKKSQM
ncbi:MAG: MBL fold metallo-hydrolase [Reichenbachiella sp.]